MTTPESATSRFKDQPAWDNMQAAYVWHAEVHAESYQLLCYILKGSHLPCLQDNMSLASLFTLSVIPSRKSHRDVLWHQFRAPYHRTIPSLAPHWDPSSHHSPSLQIHTSFTTLFLFPDSVYVHYYLAIKPVAPPGLSLAGSCIYTVQTLPNHLDPGTAYEMPHTVPHSRNRCDPRRFVDLFGC
ncbi:hypothetical protein ARMGADRAFT_1091407 [Armillaria gallica]|uniref:Uncharacterized protein n=1 Tax=Armillaria gallica TaxID=47427 RepID=A0A2H3CHN6_ARMGA|nr:hypothetical protein ARMGADRAFT_1091407 [Armillaria gallica]